MTSHDRREEKDDGIELEPFKNLLKSLPQLNFKIRQLVTVETSADEIRTFTKADSFPHVFPLSSESDLRTFLYQCVPGFSIASSKIFWEMKLEWKIRVRLPLA